MKIIEAINRIDALMQNTYTQTDKVQWLSRLDWMVKRHIIDTHEGAEEVSFADYDDNTDINTEMLIPAPYDDVYLRWLEAQIHYYNGDYEEYNNAIEVYNEAYTAYKNYYNRTHMPIGRSLKFF